MDIEIVCKRCGNPQSEMEFYPNRTYGRVYRKKICRTCDNGGRSSRKQNSWIEQCRSNPNLKKAKSDSAKKQRLDSKHLPLTILWDTRCSDKKHGCENDLDKEWIRETISAGCFYCGEISLRMTLDRIDNAVGHIKNNLHPACLRCNYFRRDMPFEAWITIAPAVKAARESGLFGSWIASWKAGRTGNAAALNTADALTGNEGSSPSPSPSTTVG